MFLNATFCDDDPAEALASFKKTGHGRPLVWCLCSRHDSTDGCLTTVLEEVEGVWLGAAVTLFPVPMSALQFPPELLRGCLLTLMSLLPSTLLSSVRLSED